ncbi:MAG: hypothetical protein KA163_14320 [Bacteroidia bacterium]|nr:hypothetical protein [Bacteroidia bacterium]
MNFDINQPLLGHFVTDSHEYYNSAENFYTNGVYSPDVRAPGLGIIYLLFRVLFSKTITLNIILVLQWFISAIATYVLSITISSIVKKNRVFYFVFFLVSATHYIFTWNNFFLTDSLAISFFIFSIYYLQRFTETNLKKHLFWSGFFIAWCIFLRPVFLLFCGVICIYLLLHFLKTKFSFKTIFFYFLLYFSVFMFFDSAWVIRNYSVKNKIVLLNDIDGYTVISDKNPYPALYAFMQSWGGDLEHQMFWFEPEMNTDYSMKDTTLPSYMYTSQFNRDSLYLVKKRFRAYNLTLKDSIIKLINASLNNFTQSVKEEKPFLYYIETGIIYSKKIFLSGYGIFYATDKRYKDITGFKKFAKISNAILFYSIFFLGLLSSIWLLLRKTKPLLFLLIMVAYLNIIFICFYFRVPEFRYLVPSIMVFVCLAGIALEKFTEKLQRKLTSA